MDVGIQCSQLTQKGCRLEEMTVGWTRGKKDGKMLLAILPEGDSSKHDIY